MQRIVMISNFQEYRKDQIVLVENNFAHYLIDNDYARLAKSIEVSDKMVGSKSKKNQIEVR